MESFTGKHLTGPGSFDRTFTADRIPVYVKAGTILPQQPPSATPERSPSIRSSSKFYPHRNQHASSYSVYEDSSKGENYIHGEFAWTQVEVKHPFPKQFDVNIAAARGALQHELQPRLRSKNLVRLHRNGSQGGRRRIPSAATDPNSPGWRYDKDKAQLIVRTPSRSVFSKTDLSIKLKSLRVLGWNSRPGATPSVPRPGLRRRQGVARAG